MNQTYKNIEIVIVNDGSTDNTPQICDEYAGKDSRVRVIHQENHGSSHARNTGLNAARGEYIAFSDSDDYMGVNSIKALYDGLIKYDADLSAGYLLQVIDGTIISAKRFYEDKVMTREEALHYLFFDKKYINYSQCSKLYKASIFKDAGISFTGMHFEDMIMSAKYVNSSNKIVALSGEDVVYYYRQQSSVKQQIGKGYNITGLKDLLTGYDSFYEYILSQEDKNGSLQAIAMLYLCAIIWSSANGQWYKKINIEIKRRLKNAETPFYKNTCLPLKKKLEIFLFLLGKAPYTAAMKLYGKLK